MGRSPASRIVASPMSSSHLSLSAPSVAGGGESEASSLRYMPSTSSSTDHAALSRNAFLIDHNALSKMTSINEQGICPLEEYLFALSYISRLGNALEGYRREYQHQYQRTNMQTPSTAHHPYVPFLNLYVASDSIRLSSVLKIAEGEDIPPLMDIRIAERYFERCVSRLGNELAFVSFVNACRLATSGTFSAIARIMNAQMEWNEDSVWRPSLQLTVWSHEGSNPRARLSLGIVIDQTNISVLLLVSSRFISIALCLRPTRPDPNERSADASKHLIQLIYNTQTNSVMRRCAANDDDPSGINQLLANISEKYARSNERSLWPAVQCLAHNFVHSKNVVS
ncbi:unnamed protein product [Anisakis simplex]|uniref:Ras-GEF domain-containing protein n=1 Tax=Anisakis simplex TaxID=6269 RepID=A0A0M3K5A1_ANISI|nr:unnamed protein product [Anisakis simplex]